LLLAISTIYCIDILIFLLFLPWGQLVSLVKEPCSGLWGLGADIYDCQQIGHHFGLLHDDLLVSLDIAKPISKGIDDPDVLDIRDSIPGFAEIFHIIPKAFIVLLLDGVQGFSCRQMLICALEIADKHDT
jgi:hypothetical protein